MTVMTEALRALAGSRLRAALLRFTRTPLSGALTGAASTALMQSSSATTVATVGFVSAGLISFPASLGIIFGANVGSTGLGWLVAVLGLRLELGRLMLPLVFVGACLRLLCRGRLAQAGLALAGFSLLFVGIASLQEAMAGQGLLLDPARFDGASVAGRLQLVLLGLLTTLITQSSGAGVATALTALSAGAIDLSQAGALVIGMDVGTTVTAVIASIGAGLSARRTALAHVIFNLLTALIAFLLLPLYLGLAEQWLPRPLAADPEFAVTARPPAADQAGDSLEESPPADSELALSQAQAALTRAFLSLMQVLRQALNGSETRSSPPPPSLAALQADLDRIELYLDQIHLRTLDRPEGQRLLHLLHSLDHLQRLHERCEEEPERAGTVRDSAALRPECVELVRSLRELEGPVLEGRWSEAVAHSRSTGSRLHQRVRPFRQDVLAEVASGSVELAEGTQRLEAMRWLRRVSQHLQRICGHLDLAAGAADQLRSA